MILVVHSILWTSRMIERNAFFSVQLSVQGSPHLAPTHLALLTFPSHSYSPHDRMPPPLSCIASTSLALWSCISIRSNNHVAAQSPPHSRLCNSLSFLCLRFQIEDIQPGACNTTGIQGPISRRETENFASKEGCEDARHGYPRCHGFGSLRQGKIWLRQPQQGARRLSTTLDSWNQDQLKLISLGGNGRAHVFFKQHGWTEGGRIESKYTSRAADLYRQLLAKEVAKSMASLASSVPQKSSNEPQSPTTKAEDFFAAEQQPKEVADPTPAVKSAPAPTPTPTPTPTPAPALSSRSSSFTTRKPTSALGAKKIGATKTGGLGVKKLTTKPSEDLYDQKPAEVKPEPVAPAPSSTTTQTAPRSSRFLYMDDVPSIDDSPKKKYSSSHVAAPSTNADFFSDFGGSPVKSSFSSGRAIAQVLLVLSIGVHRSRPHFMRDWCHGHLCLSDSIDGAIIDTSLPRPDVTAPLYKWPIFAPLPPHFHLIFTTFNHSIICSF